MFTVRQKLLLGGAVLVAVLLVAGSYFGRHWFFGPDVEPTPEHPLTARRSAVTSVSQHTSPVDSRSEDESFSDVGSTTDSDEILSSEELAALSDEDLTDLADALSELEQDEEASSDAKGDFPEVPDGFPMTPVWLKDYFHKRDFSDHVLTYRVLIELWNQGDHDFTSGISDVDSGRVYPIYPDVIYVKWDSNVREGPDGDSIEVPYVSARVGLSSTIDSLVNNDGPLFTEDEILSGAYKTKYPGIKFVDYDSAGYEPATVLGDY